MGAKSTSALHAGTMPAIPLIKKRRRKDAILRAKGSAGTKSRARHTMQQQQQRNRPALMLKASFAMSPCPYSLLLTHLFAFVIAVVSLAEK
jgi:hypothetical protein